MYFVIFYTPIIKKYNKERNVVFLLQINPEVALKMFIPHFTSSILTFLEDRKLMFTFQFSNLFHIYLVLGVSNLFKIHILDKMKRWGMTTVSKTP